MASESRVDRRRLTAHYKMFTVEGEFVDNIRTSKGSEQEADKDRAYISAYISSS